MPVKRSERRPAGSPEVAELLRRAIARVQDQHDMQVSNGWAHCEHLIDGPGDCGCADARLVRAARDALSLGERAPPKDPAPRSGPNARPSLRVRDYRPSDRALVDRWRLDLHASVARTRPEFDQIPRMSEVRRDVAENLRELRRTKGFVLIAELDGRPVGYLLAEVKALPSHHDRVMRRPQLAAQINLLYVEPGARRRGVGTALLEHAQRRFRAVGVDNLQLFVAAGNTEARRLYREVGYRELGLHLRKGLSKPPRSWEEMRRRRARALRSLASRREA
jgi:ribosomal protein S18 acetylase RimI-like enzyme